MFELLIELYSEEIPPNLQISARKQIEKLIIKELNNLKLNYKDLKVYSTPTRLSLFVKNLPSKIKISESEIKGPKVGVPQNIVESFAYLGERSHYYVRVGDLPKPVAISSQNVSRAQINKFIEEKRKIWVSFEKDSLVLFNIP